MNYRQLIKNLQTRLRRYISPLFLVLLVAAFILWYIAKLNYTYTTTEQVRVNMDGVPFSVTCVVEGTGTNLFRDHMQKKLLHIPLKELKYKRLYEQGHEGKIALDSASLQRAVSARLTDLKVHSVADIPEVDYPAQKP